MRMARRLLHATFISLINLASIVLGFWAYRLADSTNQILVQVPVAVLSGSAIIALWLARLPRSGAEYAVVSLLAFPVGAAIFTVAHYALTGYVTSVGNILGLWGVQISEILVAAGVVAAWVRQRAGWTRDGLA